ncbi:GNAT family N-acetyltransferase [Streptomyces sp. NPDC006703]|uniref:GNAT family N-acetyltransferase n=1 Tax=Streptomyces sp. NPDC006703 TaxID=3364759 RepID=UPI0036C8A097
MGTIEDMAKRRSKTKGPRKPAGWLPQRVTPQRLRDGWVGPSKTTIRLVRPAEADAVVDLLRLAGEEPEPTVATSIRAEQIATVLGRALDQTPRVLVEDLKTAVRNGGGSLLELSVGLGLLLVSVDDDGAVIGALLAHPPVGFLTQLEERGVPTGRTLAAYLAVAKVKALAVTPSARGKGIGAALLRRCGQVYWQCGYHLLFGQFDPAKDGGLADFYSKQGFTVAPKDGGIDMEVIFGLPVTLHTEGKEQAFYRWRHNT